MATPAFLQDRIAELEALARESDTIRFEEIADHLPGEPRSRAAALAALLDLNPLYVAKEEVGLDRLKDERATRQKLAALTFPLGGSPAGICIPHPNDWGKTEYVDGSAIFPAFERDFRVHNAQWYAMLEIEALTSYDYSSPAAPVLINGTEVGEIPPFPSPQFQEPHACSVFFSAGNLIGPYPYGGSLNKLRITPPPTGGWLVLRNWRIVYQSVT